MLYLRCLLDNPKWKYAVSCKRGSDQKCKSGNCQCIMELKAKGKLHELPTLTGRVSFSRKRPGQGFQLEFAHFPESAR